MQLATQTLCSVRSADVSLYIYHGNTISIDADHFTPREWTLDPFEQICRSALQHLIHIGEVTDAVVARYITQKQFRMFQHRSGGFTVFLHAEKIGMLPLPVASMDVGPVAEWIRTEKKRQRIHLPDTFQTTAPDDTYVCMPIGGAPKPVHHLQHEPPEPHPEVGETAPSQECQDLDVMERRIAESITASPDMSSADARVRHIATIVAQATARANVHVSRFEVTWLKVSKTYADFHELLVDSGVGGTVERVAVFWNMWRKLRYEVRQIEISFAVAKDAMSILRERTRQFEELCATHKESAEILSALEEEICTRSHHIRYMEIRCGHVDAIYRMYAALQAIRQDRTVEWNPTLGPEVTRRFSPTTSTRWPPIRANPTLVEHISINPITSIIAEYTEAVHANQDYLATASRTMTDTFLRIEQTYYAAVTAPFVPDVAAARAAVAMTAMVSRTATVAVNRALTLAAATTQEKMHLTTNRGARNAENRYVLIKEYVHDSRQFASHVETLQSRAGSDSADLVQAANAAHYFALQAFYQAYKMHEDNTETHQGTFE